MPELSVNHPDVLTADMRKVYEEEEVLPKPDYLGTKLFEMGDQGPRGDQVQDSTESGFGDLVNFTGSVSYGSRYQGYDVTAVHVEKTLGFEIQRRLMDDDRQDIFKRNPRGLAQASARTKDKDAARLLGNGDSNDATFFSHSEGVALFSNSHTTTTGTSTSVGFDNYVTTPLSAAAVAAGRIQMAKFRDLQSNLIGAEGDELWIPPDLYETAFEIVSSMGKVDSDQNNKNVHNGRYNIYEWKHLIDWSTQNWVMGDSRLRRDNVKWFQRIADEFAFVEDFETITGKWRLYTRYSYFYRFWQFGLGAFVD